MNLMGAWDPVIEGALGIVGVHAVVLHTGKVLYWCFDQRAVGQLGKDNDLFQQFFNNPNLGSYQLWDPANPSAPPNVQAIGRNSFCAGQCSMGDGTIFVAGGQDGAGAAEVTGEWDKWGAAVFGGEDNGALKDMQTYDPVADAWNRWPDLADGRYYPTCVTLPDGSAFVAGGLSNLQQWVFSGGNWCENDQFEMLRVGEGLAGPTPQQHFKSADQYPIIRLLPGTRTLFVHIETSSWLFDLDTASFIGNTTFALPANDAASNPVGRQTYPMQTGHVLLPQKEGDKPRIMFVGGSTFTNFDYNAGVAGVLDFVSNAPAVLGAFIFDFDPVSPTNSSWRLTRSPPTAARLLCDTVLLPDGTVFVVNGIQGGAAAGHSKDASPVAEIFDPVTETFTAVASPDASHHPRGYHSTAILLPSGKVAIAGNTDAYNPGEPNRRDDVSIQVYSPPYLFNGPPPVVTGVPANISYGSSLTLDTSGGPAVARVMMMRPCAVTHTVDMDQRAVELDITGGLGTVTVQIPTDHSLAPPGFYMLFFLAGDNTPAQAQWVQLADAVPTFPPWNLGTYTGPCVIKEVFDGDLTIEKVEQNCHLTLESRHGSITINGKIDSNSFADLKAAGSVTIGNTIDQHSIVRIVAGGNVSIGQKIDVYADARIKAGGDITIGDMVDHYANADLNAGGKVSIGTTLNQHCTFNIVAQGDVTLGHKIDQHSSGTIESVTGSITIQQRLDANSVSMLIADQGDVTIVQAMAQGASATIEAPNGNINIGAVEGGTTLRWHAKALNCAHQDGNITEF
jgi:hypothetical protein